MVKPKQITQIASSAGIKQEELEVHGPYKAKVSLKLLERLSHKPNAKLINVTSITPTRAGEGKTSTAIGLTQALACLKRKVILCLREPSLGPTFGIKGGGCGSGHSQIIPMDDINLHFTRDIYAVASAHNLLASMLDNHIYNGNKLGIDTKKIKWRRVVDINDRSLRNITIDYKGKFRQLRYQSGFDITASSEIMAILALTTSIADLKKRLSMIIVAYTKNDKPVRAKDIKATGAMAALLKDAIRPNLVQTKEGQAVFVHTGPFANIAHGNNSFLSLAMASKLADYLVTENGFGTDLGAEKFYDIVCRLTVPGTNDRLIPSVTVLVASVRGIKANGGMANLKYHIENIKKFGVIPIVAINKFPKDKHDELAKIKEYCGNLGVDAAISNVVARGGQGGIDLAQKCIKIMINNRTPTLKFIYDLEDSTKQKIHKIATRVYGASGVTYTKEAEKDIARFKSMGLDNLPINIAKTHLSLSDDSSRKGVPRGWKLKIRSVKIAAGAGFLIPIAGKILLMPGLPQKPAAENIDIDEKGRIIGLV